MKYIRIKAVVAGLVIDIIGSELVGLVRGVVAYSILLQSGAVGPDAMMASRSNTYLQLFGVIGTTFFTGLGGYLAAYLSPRGELVNSLTVGMISLVLGLAPLIGFLPPWVPAWKIIAGAILTVPAAITGGYIMKCRRARRGT